MSVHFATAHLASVSGHSATPPLLPIVTRLRAWRPLFLVERLHVLVRPFMGLGHEVTVAAGA